jgi:hypothetical protein
MSAKTLVAFISGLLFGLGLTVAGMIYPQKVIGFLDIAGAWDPSLAVVLGVALVTTAIGYRLVFGRPRPVLGGQFAVPRTSHLDSQLLGGAAVFGIGWGLVGFCPGPAIGTLALGQPITLLFIAAMIAGMAAHAGWSRWQAAAA